MASEARLYTFSQETKDFLRKFRLTTSRASEPAAVIFFIDKITKEIRLEEDTVYHKLEELVEELPDHSPRFILLSHPVTLASGRLSCPYVMLSYMPTTCNAALRMLYAGAKELMRNTSEVTKIFDIDSPEDIEEIPEKLREG